MPYQSIIKWREVIVREASLHHHDDNVSDDHCQDEDLKRRERQLRMVWRHHDILLLYHLYSLLCRVYAVIVRNWKGTVHKDLIKLLIENVEICSTHSPLNTYNTLTLPRTVHKHTL